MPRATRSSARKSKAQEEVVEEAPATSASDEPMEDDATQAVNGVSKPAKESKKEASPEAAPVENGDTPVEEAGEKEDEPMVEPTKNGDAEPIESGDEGKGDVEMKESVPEETEATASPAEKTKEDSVPDKVAKEEANEGEDKKDAVQADAVQEKEEKNDAAQEKEEGKGSASDEEPKKESSPEEGKNEDSAPEQPGPEVFVDRDRKLLAQKPSQPSEKLTELEKYWKPIKDDPNDFTGWTYLLQYVDAGDDIPAAVEVYKEFLSRYPYCYGYWKKYADYLKKKCSIEESEKAFEEGVRAIPLSVDLWLHYVNHMRTTYEKDEGGDEKVRQVLERASHACGLDYRSFKMWETYLKWELEQGKHANVLKIYDRLLRIPTAQHLTFFDGMKDFVNEHNPKDYLAVDEFIALRTDVLAEMRAANGGVDPEAPVAAAAGDNPPGDDAPPGDVEAEKTEVVMSDDETKAIREKVIAKRTEVYSQLEVEIKKRQIFEDAIKRPYFHVKQLEKGQLKTWREYLDFEIKEGNPERIRVLFERSFIACALYEEFWLKYVEYLRSLKVPADDVSEIFRRTCTVHLRKRLSINLQWAIFEECRQKYDRSMEILDTIEEYFGTCLPIASRKIGLARRSKKMDEVERLFLHYIDTFRKRGDTNQADAIIVKWSRFVDKVFKDRKRAEEIIEDALKRSPDNPRLYMAMVDILLDDGPERNKEILEVFDRALNAELPAEVKLLFAHRKMEYLEDFGDDVSQCERAYDEYSAFVKKTKEDRKRTVSSDEGLEHEEGSVAKRPRLSKPPTPTPAPSSNIAVRTSAPPAAAAAAAAAPSYSSYPSAYAAAAAAPAAAAAAAPTAYSAYGSYPYGYQQGSWGYGASAAAGHYPYSNTSYNYNYYGQR